MFLISTSCTKEKEMLMPEIKEHFASEDTNVKEEIKNFLFAANRISNVANKIDSTTTLQDKEPNEGAWLMEAAINVERYGNIEKDVVDLKTYIIEVNNKVLPSGILKMDAADIILKYNQLLTDIVQDEINQKVASLIDFQIIEILNDKTRIQVDVNFANETENLTLNITGVDRIAPFCTYENENNLTFTNLPTLPLELPVSVPQVTYPYNTDGQLSTFGATVGFGGLNMSYYYHKSAENHGFYNYLTTPYQTNGTNIYLDPNDPNLGILDWIPYTNVIMFNLEEIEELVGCANFDKVFDYYPDNSISHSTSLNKLKHMNDYIESTLPSSQSNEYYVVNNILYSDWVSINNPQVNYNFWILKNYHISFVLYNSN